MLSGSAPSSGGQNKPTNLNTENIRIEFNLYRKTPKQTGKEVSNGLYEIFEVLVVVFKVLLLLLGLLQRGHRLILHIVRQSGYVLELDARHETVKLMSPVPGEPVANFQHLLGDPLQLLVGCVQIVGGIPGGVERRQRRAPRPVAPLSAAHTFSLIVTATCAPAPAFRAAAVDAGVVVTPTYLKRQNAEQRT